MKKISKIYSVNELDVFSELDFERTRLNKMVQKALLEGTKLTSDEIVKQSKLVDQLLNKQEEKIVSNS